MANKKQSSEKNICTQCILLTIRKADWNIERQVSEEVFFTSDRIFVNEHEKAIKEAFKVAV
jgi:type I site-specific restriction endonuclease